MSSYWSEKLGAFIFEPEPVNLPADSPRLDPVKFRQFMDHYGPLMGLAEPPLHPDRGELGDHEQAEQDSTQQRDSTQG